MRTSVSVLVVVLSVMAAVPRVSAQTPHAAPQSALDAVLQQKVADTGADREVVRRVLANPDVGAIADRAGIDLRRATSAVATLSDAELAQVAAQARQAEQALAGGQSRVVLSTTVIIIGLLVLILLIVALD